ncbi:MAG: hypothetical protein AAF483_29120 [Planctomycetota bacterium]
MITFPKLAPDSVVFPIVDRWIDAVAASDYSTAADFLYNAADWTLDRLSSAIVPIAPDPTFEPWAGEQFAITPVFSAKVGERFNVPELNEPAPLMSFWLLNANPKLAVDYPHCIGDVLYPLPINGYWSDISASFHLREVSPNSVALLLHDFCVIRD